MVRLIQEPTTPDWDGVIQRLYQYPLEAIPIDPQQDMNALHSALYRYAPIPIIESILSMVPEACAQARTKTGEYPLHIAFYTSPEETIQRRLLQLYPKAAHQQDVYGDTPLHYAIRHMASLTMIQQLIQIAPATITTCNVQGMTPLAELSKSYIDAPSLEEIVHPHDGEEHYDWYVLVLLLRTIYIDLSKEDTRTERNHEETDSDNLDLLQQEESIPIRTSLLEGPSLLETSTLTAAFTTTSIDYEWMVHAAASTPYCPVDVLTCLIRLFPNALTTLRHGKTPLFLACQLDASTTIKQQLLHQRYQKLSSSQDPDQEDELLLQVLPTVTIRDEGHDGSFHHNHNDDGLHNQLGLRGQLDEENNETGEGTSQDHDVEDLYQLTESSSSILTLLQCQRSAAKVPCGSTKDIYPLAMALQSGYPWSVIFPLFRAHPLAIEGRHKMPQTSTSTSAPALSLPSAIQDSYFLDPLFLVAAVCAPDLDTVYGILRMDPNFFSLVKDIEEKDGSCAANHTIESFVALSNNEHSRRRRLV